MQFQEKAIWSLAIEEHDTVESRSFLIGLGNGIWMSAILALALYWLL
jgi:hypothetical protein